MIKRIHFLGGDRSLMVGPSALTRAAILAVAAFALAAPLAAQTPLLDSVTPPTAVRGATGNVTLTGTNLRAPFVGTTGCSTAGGAVRARVQYLNGQGLVVDEVERDPSTIGDTSIANVPYGLAVTTTSGVYSIRTLYDAFVVGVGFILGCSATQKSVSFTVQGPTITTDSLPRAFVGEPYGPVTLTAIGLIGTPTWGLFTGNLPPGLTLSSSGVISGTPTSPGFYFPDFAVSDPNGGFTNAQIALDVVDRITITPPTLPNGVVGETYNQLITAPTAFEVEPLDPLPPGLDVQTNYDAVNDVYTFRLAGTPTAVGTFNFTLEAQGSTPGETPTYGTRAYSLTIESGVTVLTNTLPAGTVGSAYSVPLQSNRAEPPTWALVAGSLPPGLTLNPGTGVISGTPTTAGAFSFSVQVSVNTVYGVLTSPPQALSITVVVPVTLTITTTALAEATLDQEYLFTLSYSLTGSTAPVVWEITGGSLPGGIRLDPATGVLRGTPGGIGEFPVTFRARLVNGQLQSAPRSYLLKVIGPPLSLSPSSMPQGAVGQAYLVELRPSGGDGNISVSISSGSLPPGLTLGTSPPRISGTPTEAGSFRFIVRLLSEGRVGDFPFTVEILPFMLELAPPTLPEAYLGELYEQRVEARGGKGPYTFALQSGALPEGFVLNGATGVISGRPLAAGEYGFTIIATDASRSTGVRSYRITVRPPLTLGPQSLPDGTEGQSYSASLVAAGGRPPYSFSLRGGMLPPGLSLSEASISGLPAQGGTFPFVAAVTDQNGRSVERNFEIFVLGLLRLEPETLPNGTLLRDYSASLTLTGAQNPVRWSVEGNLPPGILFQAGVFRGAPTAMGTFNFLVTATDAANRSMSRSYSITVTGGIWITTTSLPGGAAGQPYTASLAAEGGQPPYRWSITPALPEGLSLDPGLGLIAGLPTAGGTFPLSVRVEDQTGLSATASLSLTLSMPPPPPLRIIDLPVTALPATQPTFNVALAEPYPLPLSGEVDLSFAPVRGPDDPAVQFANGGRRLPFTIGANQTAANFGGSPPALQTGTVAGLITLTSRYQSGGTDVTPTPPPTQTLRIDGAAPVLTRLDLSRGATGFELIIFGYSNTRDVVRANVRLTPSAGGSLAGSEFTIDLASLFQTYYNSAASVPFGTQFRLVLPFNVSGSQQDIGSVSVTLTNSVGASNTLTANF